MYFVVQITPPLEPEDCACAVSYLWWCQELRGDEKLWDVVSKASKSIKALKANKSGLAFWNMIEKEEYTPPYTVSYNSLLQPEYPPKKMRGRGSLSVQL